MVFLWIGSIGAFALAAVMTRRRHMFMHASAKLGATGSMVVMALEYSTPYQGQPLYIIGLCCALCGELAFLWPRRNRFMFLFGLLSFVGCLVFYGLAFNASLAMSWAQVSYAILPLTLGIAVLAKLWPHFGIMRMLAVLYTGTLVFMTWRALSLFDAPAIALGDWLLFTIGALLFFYSDSLLARRRFAKQPAPYIIEIGSYFAAQLCIALGMITIA